MRTLNLAYINHEPLAKVVLAVSSIEALAAGDAGWTPSQLDMIKWAADRVEAQFGNAAEAVADAIRRVRYLSLRQQAKRLLDRHGLLELWPDWEDVYGRRSGLFHGGAGDDDPDSHDLANDAIRVCGAIVLSIAQRQGAILPNAASQHFPIQ